MNQLNTLLNYSRIDWSNRESFCFVKNGCRSICLIYILYYPFFLIVFKIKSLASSVTSTHDGNVISSETYEIKWYLQCDPGPFQYKFWKEFCPISTHRSSFRCSRHQFYHRTLHPLRSQVDSKEDYLRQFSWDRDHGILPIQSQKFSPLQS